MAARETVDGKGVKVRPNRSRSNCHAKECEALAIGNRGLHHHEKKG
jgi:hypothetical protein